MLVVPPYIIYMRVHTLTLHIVTIPDDSLQPLQTYPVFEPPRERFPGWSASLPWLVSDQTPEVYFTLLEANSDRIIVRIDFCRNRRSSRCKLVITKESSTQTIAGREVTFDFDAHFEDIEDDKGSLLIGKGGIPGMFLVFLTHLTKTNHCNTYRDNWMVLNADALGDRCTPSSGF